MSGWKWVSVPKAGMLMRRILRMLGTVLVLGLLAGCSFPDAAVWRAAAYKEISAAQLNAGEREAARLSAEEAVRAAEEARGTAFDEWAAGAAAAALVCLAPGEPALDGFLTELQMDGWGEQAFPSALLYAAGIAAYDGNLAAALSYAGRIDDPERRRDVESLTVLLAGSRSGVLQVVSDALVAEETKDDERVKRLSILAIVLARHRDPGLALEVFDRVRPLIVDSSDSGMPLWVSLHEGFMLGVLDGYRDLLWTAQPTDVKSREKDAIVSVTVEIALAHARRFGADAGMRIVARPEPGDDRVWAYALLAHRLAAEGRLPGARLAATAALDTLRLSFDVAELDEATLVEHLPTTYLLAGEAVPLGPGDGDPLRDADRLFGSGIRKALVQTYLGDRTGAAFTLAGVEARLVPDDGDRIQLQGDDLETVAHLCWAYVLIGEVQSAIDLAWRIDYPDIRAFALLPAVAALADRGDFASARDLAETMFH